MKRFYAKARRGGAKKLIVTAVGSESELWDFPSSLSGLASLESFSGSVVAVDAGGEVVASRLTVGRGPDALRMVIAKQSAQLIEMTRVMTEGCSAVMQQATDFMKATSEARLVPVVEAVREVSETRGSGDDVKLAEAQLAAMKIELVKQFLPAGLHLVGSYLKPTAGGEPGAGGGATPTKADVAPPTKADVVAAGRVAGEKGAAVVVDAMAVGAPIREGERAVVDVTEKEESE